MQQKAIDLQNYGMRRDSSISKADNKFAFDNHNIRITARDHDTLISVTNERGNKRIPDLEFLGDLVGWNVLNHYMILFTSEFVSGDPAEGTEDRYVSHIYRVEYTPGDEPEFKSISIFEGDLGFSTETPIESVVDYETEDIQKIYWIDGEHVLRFLNFADAYLEEHLEEGTLDNPVFTFRNDNTWFDSTRPANGMLNVSFKKDNGGSNRPNGTAQYFITYYNKNGQQTGICYSSPMVYLSPDGNGGTADGYNSNRIVFNISNADPTFEYVRLYQIFRSSIDGTVVAYLVAESETSNDGSITLVDSGAPLSTVDAYSILYLGSREVHAGTMTHKDNTLFLGDLRSIGNAAINGLEEAIKENAFILSDTDTGFRDGVDWESSIVDFVYSDTNDLSLPTNNIPYVAADGYYPYENQLKYTNAQITTFKGGEKYRFALQFFNDSGLASKSFWIGDKVNPYYPNMSTSGVIKRVLAVCTIPDAIVSAAEAAGFTSVQLMIAKATYSDRSVLAQGLVCPTVFNVYNRCSDSPYSQASWMYRPKGSEWPFAHFDTTRRSDTRYAELQTSWWEDDPEGVSDNIPLPIYYLGPEGEEPNVQMKLVNKPYGYKEYAKISIKADIWAQKIITRFWGSLTIEYYYAESQDPDKVMTYSLGGSKIYSNSRQKLIADWLNAYESANVPATNRLSDQQIWDYCEIALGDAKAFRPGHYACPTIDKADLDFNSMDYNNTYAQYNREYYFIDENVVTLNSPEIEYNAVNVDRNSGLKFRIVGAAKLTSNISDYDIQADGYKYPGDRMLRFSFSSQHYAQSVAGIISWPLYVEYGYEMHQDELVMKYVPFAYMTYMWHKSGSIPEFTYDPNNSGDGNRLSVLSSKRFANLRFAYCSFYNNYRANVWDKVPIDVRQFNSDNKQVYNLKVGSITKSYMANIDDLVVMPDDVEYPVFYSENSVAPSGIPELKTLQNSSDPVRITYNSRPHAVISLPQENGSDVLLPYLFDDDKYKQLKPSDFPGENVTGPHIPWSTIDYTGRWLLYRKIDSGFSTFTNGAYGTAGAAIIQVSDDTNRNLICLKRNAVCDLYTGVVNDIPVLGETDGLSEAKREIDKKFGATSVYIHIKTSDDRELLVDHTRMFYNRVNVYSELSLPVWTVSFTADMPMNEVEYRVYVTKSDNTGTIITPRTQMTNGAVQLNGSRFGSIIIDGLWESGKLWLYDMEFEVSYEESRVMHVSGTISACASTAPTSRIYRMSQIFFQDAKYIEYSSFADPQNEKTFLNIANSPHDILRYTSDNNASTVVSDGVLNVDYAEPIQDIYKLPSSGLISSGDNYMFIGELYNDYDELAKQDIKLDTRYGGITSSAVESNTFISASDRKLLTDYESSGLTQAKAVLSVSELFDALRNSTETSEYSMSIDKVSGMTSEIITLDSLSRVTVDDFMPTVDNKAKLVVVRDGNSWKTAFDGDWTEGQQDAVRNNPNYKIAILRYGYARRGKWRKYTNKYGEVQTSHTTRNASGFRDMRKGYANGLPAKRLRIIGYDLLIAKRSLAHSMTFYTQYVDEGGTVRERTNYADSTLISSLGDALVLPAITHGMWNQLKTRNGRISYTARHDLAELYVGLYHKEGTEWKLVSNVVKVRGRDAANEKVWEFDESRFLPEI